MPMYCVCVYDSSSRNNCPKLRSVMDPNVDGVIGG